MNPLDIQPKSAQRGDLALYAPPEDLDGRYGKNRAPADKNRSGANNDYEAIQKWLSTFNDETHAHTQRNYRKEAERLLLWAVMERQVALSSLSSEDVAHYRSWLTDPMPHAKWVADRAYERTDSRWRPFLWRNPPKSQRSIKYSPTHETKTSQTKRAGLSESSVAQSISVCRALFSWLVDQRYLDYNPFLGISKKKANLRVNTTRSFSRRQWGLVVDAVNSLDQDALKTKRLKFILTFAYTTGLRLSEMAQAQTGHIFRAEDLGSVSDDASQSPGQYFIRVRGKGNQLRDVPLTQSARNRLAEYLQARGLPVDPVACDPQTPLIAKLAQTRHGWAMGDAAIYTLLADFFSYTASRIKHEGDWQADVRRFEQASTHWLRHTHGTHALAYGADLNVVKENMGHKSLTTTSLYVRPEKRLQAEQMQAFDDAATI